MKQKNCKGSCKADYIQERIKGLSYYSQEYIYFYQYFRRHSLSTCMYVRPWRRKAQSVKQYIPDCKISLKFSLIAD